MRNGVGVGAGVICKILGQWHNGRAATEGAVGAALEVQFRRLRDVDGAKVTSILVERRVP